MNVNVDNRVGIGILVLGLCFASFQIGRAHGPQRISVKQQKAQEQLLAYVNQLRKQNFDLQCAHDGGSVVESHNVFSCVKPHAMPDTSHR